nr:phage tail spike protein [uncultured Marvinbryantia sp.]
MLKLFDRNYNAIGHITKYKDCRIESDVSTGDKTLYFTYLAKDPSLENEMYVQTEDDEYVIKEAPADSSAFPQIVAVLNLEGLQAKAWQTFSVTDTTVDEAARTALAGSGWTVGYCDVTKRRNAGMMHVNTLGVIQNLCKAFMCEPVYDTRGKTVSFYQKRGEDKGVYFLSGLNLKRLKKESGSHEFYTRVIPIGENGLTIESVNDGKNYLENYRYSSKVLTYIWKDESYTDAQALMEDAQMWLDDHAKPEASYQAEVRNLAARKPGYSVLSYSLGDTVKLVDEATGTIEEQRIVKMVHYSDNPDKDTCEISNTVLTFEEMQERYQEAAAVINFTVSADGRYTGTINVSDILHFEEGLAGSSTIGGINNSITDIQGKLALTELTVGEIEANYLKADEADLKYATIESLDATNIRVHDIEGDYASFKSLTTDEFASHTALIDKIYNEELVTAKGWMLEGSIGDAQISSLNANKLRAGTIDTAIVTVAGTDGRMQISDNTIRISDGSQVRVQIGKDASDDYTLAVWDADGNLIWDALGATENTIQRKIIRDKMVAEDAAIQALKIDFQSFDTALTDQGVTISGTVVQVGSKTLNVALSEQTQALTEQGETLTDHGAKIAANEKAISLRVTSQEFETYQTTTNERLTDAESDINGAASRLLTTESSITALQDRIALKVEQTDIDTAVNNIQIGGRNLIKKTAYGYRENNGVTISYSDAGYLTAMGTTADARNVTIVRLTDVTGLSGNYTFSVERVTGYDVVYNLSLYQNGTFKKFVQIKAGADSITFDGTGYDLGYISIANTASGRSIDLKVRFKLEKGNKVTDWTPAPEDVDNKFASYSTTAQMQSAIDLAKDSVTTTVSKTYAKKSDLITASDKITSLETWKTEASLKITKDGIIDTVGNYYAYQDDLTTAVDRITTAESTIARHADQIALRVEKSGIISAINQTAESIKISADKITLEGATIADSFTATNLHITGNSTFDGTLNGATGSFSGSVTATDGYIGDLQITSGYLLGVNGNVQTIVGTDFISIGIPNNAHRFVAASDGTVNAYNIYANGLIDATGSITSAGNIKAASMTSTGSLTAASATVSGSLKAASMTVTGSLTAASVTLKTGGLQLPKHTGTSWANSPTFTKCIVATPHTNTSYYPIIRQDTKSGNIFTLGGFSTDNERFGIFGCKKGCPTGTYDYGALLDVTNGTYYLVRCNVNVTEGDMRINGGLGVVENLTTDGNITASGKISTSGAIEVDGTVHLHNVYSYQSTEAANVRVGSTGRIARTSSSSVRYKDLVSELSAGDIEPLYDIPVHWFKYKEGYIGTEDERYRKTIPGFIVEDWEGVMPIAIDHNPDGSPEMWNNNIVVPLMFEMIKNEHRCNTEVRDSLQDCDRRIYTAEAWISSAEDRIDALQDQLAAARDEINALRARIAEQDALIAGLGAA